MERPVDLHRALGEASGLRFLCSGNVVRSAFAELYARHLGLPLALDSAATRFENPALFPETRAALLERGVPPALIAGFRPRALWRIAGPPDPRLVALGMAPEHLSAWRRAHPSHGRAFLLLEVLGPARALADPVLEGADFEATFATLARCVERLQALLAGR